MMIVLLLFLQKQNLKNNRDKENTILLPVVTPLSSRGPTVIKHTPSPLARLNHANDLLAGQVTKTT